MTTERIEHITGAAEANPEDARLYAVIGRRPEDDENSVLLVEAVDVPDAFDYFSHFLWEDSTGAWESREQAVEAYGTDTIFLGALSVRSGADLRIETWT